MFQIKKLEIENFRSIKKESIKFWKNKTVFVWKNGSWKTNILKALEKLINSKKIKEKDFFDKNKKLLLSVIISFEEKEIEIKIESEFKQSKIHTLSKKLNKEDQILLNKIDLIYIPSDRKINKNNKENGYLKLIDLILKNKESTKTVIKKTEQKLESINTKSGRKKTTLLISLLRLYLYSINKTNNWDFNIFIIDQPENFLHPHATQMIDSILQKIWELENSQIFYSTHSPDLVSNFKKWKYEIDDIVFVRRKSWISKTKKINNKYWRFNKIMINLIFKNASIFFSDAVLLVEWETEKIAIPNIYENTNLDKYSKINKKHLTGEYRENYYNLNYRNISIIDVWWKWSLHEWYIFASELFGKENVIAMMDRDKNYEVDFEMISKSIKRVHHIKNVWEKQFKKYNRIVLNWEFEHYYKKEKIRKYIADTITKRALKFWDEFDQKILDKNLAKLDIRLEELDRSNKISHTYEVIFNKYFRRYSKPTIAFNLSIWLSQNKWYDVKLLKIFAEIIEKFEK